ncbi:aminotransferase class I/II-fold pyridoxal phosphate-dependent enzyme [Saccharopolyspora sp. NPDC049426]|uniref:pyridoxal phosphate-dependent aminotransferase n=1 Tax=Saccharopolyspora sp. NPDC049426 TaxID=3155652 RepID=UPI00342118F5
MRLTHNENPWPPTPRVRAALERTAPGLHRYPTASDEAPLVEALAEHHDVPTTSILLGAGSATLLDLVTHVCTRPGATVVCPWRGWEAYPHIIARSRTNFVPIPLTSADEVDLDAIAHAITSDTAMVLLTNPHNPTGQALDRQSWRRFLARVPSGVTVVIDEAYYEFLSPPERATTASGIDTVRDPSNNTRVIVLRTFSKAFGLAGERIGYAITTSQIAADLRRCQIPFSVSRTALAAAAATFHDTAAREAQLHEIRAERDRLARELTALGYPVHHSSANMLWLPLRNRAEDFATGLARHGIIVRHWPGDGVRISVGTHTDHNALLAAARVLPR